MKLFLKILRITVIICVIVVLIETAFSDRPLNKLLEPELWGMYFMYTFVLTCINGFYFYYFSVKIGWEGAGLKRILGGAIGSIILTLIGFFICRLIDKTLINEVPVEEFLSNETFGNYIFPLLFTAIVSMFFHLIYFYKALQEKRVKEQKIIAGTASAKFDALKNQLDPHFLFNSLNVLASLIDENPDQAQRFTTGLSKIYRYVLEQKDKELVSLQEELKFANTYMKLLKMRFEDSIYFELPEALSNDEAKVVPLSLQLLLENTIKHNIVNENKPLRIKIYEVDGYLIVENNFQKKEVLGTRKGVGLQNIVNRYHVVTERKVLIEQTENFFRVKLPVLTKQISVMETVDNNQENAYFKAKQRVKEMKEFYGNLISYCVVIPFLIFINYYTYWSFQWFWFPLFGWGIGLTIHGFSVFGYGSDWEERKIQEIMAKDKQQTKSWK
ncbi:2TM domain-containing protein [Christiangramia forsetii]|uniref:Membrane protein containing an internal histidine kinase domain n=2 Tax=Christiangramia forsetii TaxID=411153 RepID=A0M044_CHRFK|nr:2TM domain-containing protein [Christiangramia forsetii]GGG41845.1 histidine kinase [Christiangramia forsetii]CAL65989.1 membrane protein containing an internal histidine kinase domain [Christiangramia forsetii KT0803]